MRRGILKAISIFVIILGGLYLVAPFLVEKVVEETSKEILPNGVLKLDIEGVTKDRIYIQDLLLVGKQGPIMFIKGCEIGLSLKKAFKEGWRSTVTSVKLRGGELLSPQPLSFDLDVQNAGITKDGAQRFDLNYRLNSGALCQLLEAESITGKANVEVGTSGVRMDLTGRPAKGKALEEQGSGSGPFVALDGWRAQLDIKGLKDTLNGTLDVELKGLGVFLGGKKGLFSMPSSRIHLVISKVLRDGPYRLNGNFLASGLKVSTLPIDVVRFEWQGTPSKIFLKGRLEASRVMDQSLSIRGEILDLMGPAPPSFSLEVPEQAVSLKDLGEISEALKDLETGGHLSAEIKGGGPTIHFNATSILKDWHLDLASQDIHVKGISSQLRFMLDGGQLIFPPSQPVEVEEVAIGKVKAREIGLRLSAFFEPELRILLERLKASWAKGHIYIHDLYLPPEGGEIKGIIFCDRLNLGDALSQFGLSRVYGEGVVSGKIPFVISNDGLSIQDGVLSSQPGKGGSIRIGAGNIISGQIPKGSPLYSQLQFASLALENFRYDWVNIFVDMKGDAMMVRIQLDGMPQKRLPFSYNPATGGLKREEGGSGGIRQKMRIDINISLPVNQLFMLRQGLKKEFGQ